MRGHPLIWAHSQKNTYLPFINMVLRNLQLIGLNLLIVLQPPFCTLTTHAKLGRWVWLMRMRLTWKKSQKTLDTSKWLHRNKTGRTGSAANGLDSQLCHYWELQTRKRARSSLNGGSWEGVKSIPRRTTYHGNVDSRETPVQGPLFCLRLIYNRPLSR